jgi:hypothetical protein
MPWLIFSLEIYGTVILFKINLKLTEIHINETNIKNNSVVSYHRNVFGRV